MGKILSNEEMWVDKLTKPKQGQSFRNFRKVLMNIDDDYVDVKILMKRKLQHRCPGKSH